MDKIVKRRKERLSKGLNPDLPYGNDIHWYVKSLAEAQEHIRLLLDGVIDKDECYMDYEVGWQSKVEDGSPERIITDAKDWMSGMGFPYIHRW